MRQYHNYLCVFRANPDIYDDVLDCGLDPDFRPPLPTWGICRPGTRQSLVTGDYIIFLGYYGREQPYLVKGWMKVGEKISYPDALKRFGDRPNVILRGVRQTKSSGQVRWKRKDLQKKTQLLYGTDTPRFLTTIAFGDQVYVQFDEDNHEIDNWKCQRMFLCPKKRLESCIIDGACQRELEFPSLKGYIVAAEGEWQDVGPHRLDWLTIAPPRFQGRPLHTRYNQHNVLGLSDAEVMEIVRALAMFL